MPVHVFGFPANLYEILKHKNSRVGRNPKTLETKIISERNVVVFKPSKELKKFINSHE